MLLLWFKSHGLNPFFFFASCMFALQRQMSKRRRFDEDDVSSSKRAGMAKSGVYVAPCSPNFKISLQPEEVIKISAQEDDIEVSVDRELSPTADMMSQVSLDDKSSASGLHDISTADIIDLLDAFVSSDDLNDNHHSEQLKSTSSEESVSGIEEPKIVLVTAEKKLDCSRHSCLRVNSSS